MRLATLSGAILLALSGLVRAQALDVVGVVVDAQSDMPVPKVSFFDPDSQFLGGSDDQGRFMLKVPRRQEVTLRKSGYRSNTLQLSQVGDLLDVSVTIEPLGSRLDDRTVAGTGVRRTKVPSTIAGIEEIAGMRFDLQEHLRTLPGVSGTREFSSEVSVYGSRSNDVIHLLGPFAIPNLRHLDFSFPGNTSVLSPRVLQSIKIEHDPSKGPLEQGLASAIQYQPLVPPTDRFDGTVSMGLTNREFDIATPLAGSSSLVASGRWLDPTLLKHLGDRFFSGVLTNGKNVSGRDTSKLKNTNFDLSAFDGFARVAIPMGDMTTSLNAMAAADDHQFDLYVGTTGKENPVTITKGNAQHLVVFGQTEGDLPSGFWQGYAGRVYTASEEVYGDTAGYLRGKYYENDPAHVGSNAFDSAYWSALRKVKTDDRAGLTWRPSDSLLGGEPELLGVFHLVDDTRERGQNLSNEQIVNGSSFTTRRFKQDFSYQTARGAARLRLPVAGGTLGLSGGVLWISDLDVSPEGSLSWSGPVAGFGLEGNASLRQEEFARAKTLGVLANARTTSMEVKVGAGRSLPGSLNLSTAAYFRQLEDAALAHPEMWWHVPQQETGVSASVVGVTGELDWRAFHTVQLQVNASHVQGEYELSGRTLPWEANRLADIQTLVRIHPRSDTLLSLLLSHSASIGKPYYRFVQDTSARTVAIYQDDLSQSLPDLQDLFRTDARVQLDLRSTIPPFKAFRFYFEVQNIFADFTGDWAKYFGAGNARQRGWQPERDYIDPNNPKLGSKSPVYSRLSPLFANGTGLFFSFGIEGNLSL